ncbi:MAG: polysaccharide deacetylase family protein [Acidobacteriia bacterium]|nr:polysaccharide deacetylase family protein [Terriglobia bacterium]
MHIVTTSWDDGDIRDLRIAELLVQYGMKGSFYVPVKPFNGQPSLNAEQMRQMTATGMEIGAHGVDHEIMSELTLDQTKAVVRESKRFLEDTLGSEVPMFCYPRGRYTTQTMRCLEEAGYRGARTTRMLSTSTQFNKYQMPTSAQVYPHPPVRYMRNLARHKNVVGMFDYLFRLRGEQDWVQLGKTLFDRVERQGGVWHLYGHSWEIDQLGLWGGFEELLKYVSRRDDVRYLTNSQVLQHLTASALN